MLWLDNGFIFLKFFDDASDAVSSTIIKKIAQQLGKASLDFLVLLYPY